MQIRPAGALCVPALMTILVAVEARPPRWMVAAPPPPPPVAAPAAVKPAPRRVPKILAVDPRIKARLSRLQPGVRKRLARVARRLPAKVTLLVTSAYRTWDEQKRLRPTFGVKARPGRSTHEDGRAIDVNVLVDGERISPRKNRSVIGKFMAEAGFRHLGAIDPVHYSIPKDRVEDVDEAPVLDVMTMQEAREVALEESREEPATAVPILQPLP